jgi:hypothetical protein
LGRLPTFAPEFYGANSANSQVGASGAKCLNWAKELCRSAVEDRRRSTVDLHRPIIIVNPGDTPAWPTTAIRTARNGQRARDIMIQPFGSGRCSMSSQSRRRFLTHAAFAGAAGLGGFLASGKSLAAEPPPEVTTIRFAKDPATCIAPQVFEELLRAEGFTEIRYVDVTEAHVRRADAANSDALSDMIAHGEVDFGRTFAPSLVIGMNAAHRSRS